MKFTGERMIPEKNRDDIIYVEHINRYLFASKIVKDKVVLDIASGGGYGAEMMRQKGAKEVIGVDISKEAVKYATRLYPKIKFKVGSVERIPLKDSTVDVVVSFETLEHVGASEQRKFMREIKRVLKREGVLIISTPNKEVYPKGNEYHIKEVNLKEFEDLLSQYFRNTTLYFQDSAESNYILPKELLNIEKLSDHLDAFKINNIDHSSCLYLIAICSNKALIYPTGESLIYGSIPRLNYENYHKKINSLKESLRFGYAELEKAKRDKTALQKHLDRLYGHPTYMLKHWLKGTIIKIVPQNVVKNVLVPAKKFIRTPKSSIFFKKLQLKKIENPLVSIVIPVFNKWQYTYRCLSSIARTCYEVGYEIIIVDNGSSDKTYKKIGNIKNIKYIRSEKNLGFVGGCNRGAEKAEGDYIVFLNNDTEVKEGWLYWLLKSFEEFSDAGLVGSKLVYPENILQEAGGIIWNDKKAANYGRGDNPKNYRFNYVKEVDYISAASVMIKKGLFLSLGGFDKIYTPAYCEDSDLAFKVRKAGLKVYYQPFSEVIHYEGVTAGTDVNTGLKKYQTINQQKFFKRWEKVLDKENQSSDQGTFLARDRSQQKKILLFMDEHIPTWDKDAGSYITHEYLKIFRELGYKVIFWPRNQAKLSPYTESLQQLGIEVVYGQEYFSNFIVNYGDLINIAILARPNVANEYLDLVSTFSEATIHYLTHDLHFIREERQAKTEDNKELLEKSERTKKLEFEAMEKSDISWFVSTEEEKLIKKELPEVKGFLYPWVEKIAEEDKVRSYEDRSGVFFLGGFNHTPNKDAVIWLKKEIYPLLKKEGIKISVIGSNPSIDIQSLAEEGFEVIGFADDEKLDQVFNESRVFISPLRYGAGFKGKIAKSISRGLPVVATHIGAEGMGLRDNVNIIIEDDPKKFAKEVIRLYNNKNAWLKISENSLKHAKQYYSRENAKLQLEEILNS